MGINATLYYRTIYNFCTTISNYLELFCLVQPNAGGDNSMEHNCISCTKQKANSNKHYSGIVYDLYMLVIYFCITYNV